MLLDVIILEFAKLLNGQVNSFDFSDVNNQKILQALQNMLYNLDIEAEDTSNTMDARKNDIRLRLKDFIPELELMISKIKDGSKAVDAKFKIGYIALSIWADPNNPTDFDFSAPFKDLNRDGTYRLLDDVPGATQCNHFVYEVVLRATGKKMTKGESETSLTRFGMMGAGVYFGHERDLSEAAIKYLSAPFVFGEFGDIISFSKDDSANHGNNYLGGNHVGIYIGNDLYVSASAPGVSPFPDAAKSVVLSDVPSHAHYSELR